MFFYKSSYHFVLEYNFDHMPKIIMYYKIIFIFLLSFKI